MSLATALKGLFAKPYTKVGPARAQELIETRRAVLLDVREPHEWRAGHAERARHIPLGVLAQRVRELPARRPVITVCRSGARSARAAALLAAQGYEVYNLSGGMGGLGAGRSAAAGPGRRSRSHHLTTPRRSTPFRLPDVEGFRRGRGPAPPVRAPNCRDHAKVVRTLGLWRGNEGPGSPVAYPRGYFSPASQGDMMVTIALTKDSFADTVKGEGIVLVDFWASWCGPCRVFAPVFEQASQNHPDITFGKVDTEAESELARAFQVSSIPTLMAFRDGILVFAQPGALPSAALEQVISAVRGLDMDDVRRQVAEQSAV